MDEALRALLREAEGAHDAGLWLKAASALVRAHDYDEAGRALLWARALGGETGPLDDALSPRTLDHERRGVGSMLSPGPFECFCWTPGSDAVYAATESTKIVQIGVEPGANRRVKDTREPVSALGATLREDVLIVVFWLGQRPRVELLDLATSALRETGIESWYGPYEVAAFGDREACFWDWGTLTRFSLDAPSRRDERRGLVPAAFTWLGEIVDLAPVKPGAPRTLRMVFDNERLTLSFPTRRSVERFVELATIETLGMNAQQVRDSYPCIAASPSGRHVAFAGPGRVRFVDLVTGTHRDVELDRDHEPLDARWAPSGRRLAVLTKARVHIFTFTD